MNFYRGFIINITGSDLMVDYARFFKWAKMLLALVVFVAAVTMGNSNRAYG